MLNRLLRFAWLPCLLAAAASAQRYNCDAIEKGELALPGGVPFVWPRSTLPPPPGAEITRDQVMELLKRQCPDGPHRIPAALEAFRFVPLARGQIYLVALTDYTGRAFFNGLEVVHCEGDRCRFILEVSDWPNDLDKQLVDVDGDGIYEIIINERVEYYRGGDTIPYSGYSIYKLTGRELTDVSAQYPDYYQKHLLPKIEEQLQAAGKYADAQRRAEALAAAQFAHDDYRRRVLGEKEAGLDRARAWADSDNEQLWLLGLKALEAIDTPAAATKLNELTSSNNKRLASWAKDTLKRWVIKRAQGEKK